MDVVTLVLLLLGLVLLVLAGLGVAESRLRLGWLGLACCVAVVVLGHPLVAG